MFVTIILTGFHMFCLHLFVQDVVLPVFLLKCEITVSSVNSKHRPAWPGPARHKHQQTQNIINQPELARDGQGRPTSDINIDK